MFVGSPRKETPLRDKGNVNDLSSLLGSDLALPEICSGILAVFSGTRHGATRPDVSLKSSQ